MKLLLVLLSAIFAFAHAAPGAPCTDTSQCGSNECCQILSEHMIVSKRRALSGTCQTYSLEGESCGLFDRMNGFCSCAPGTSCKALQIPIATVSTILQKRKMAPPRPGFQYDIKCVKDVLP